MLLALILLALGLAVGQWPFLEIVARVPGLGRRLAAAIPRRGSRSRVPLLAALELDRLVKDAASAHPLALSLPLAAAVLLFAAAAGIALRARAPAPRGRRARLPASRARRPAGLLPRARRRGGLPLRGESEGGTLAALWRC